MNSLEPSLPFLQIRRSFRGDRVCELNSTLLRPADRGRRESARAPGQQIDLALLPVNGRDTERLTKGIAGNFTLAEAIGLCRQARIPALIAHHYGMFAFNTIDAETIDQAANFETDLRVYRAQTNTRYSIEG
jgi:L-ascorbate metabolism protein UlaG (beta-lactamase superfamily)